MAQPIGEVVFAVGGSYTPRSMVDQLEEILQGCIGKEVAKPTNRG